MTQEKPDKEFRITFGQNAIKKMEKITVIGDYMSKADMIRDSIYI